MISTKFRYPLLYCDITIYFQISKNKIIHFQNDLWTSKNELEISQNYVLDIPKWDIIVKQCILISHLPAKATFCKPGPGCSKLLTLVNISLNFQKLISQICKYFFFKNVRSFCSAKASLIFQQKISVYLVPCFERLGLGPDKH